jgi:hypothetical protein
MLGTNTTLKLNGLMIAGAIALGGLAATDTATAQANCSMAPTPQARANCYGRQADIYRQQSRNHYGIARDQERTHRNVGRGLNVIGRFVPQARHFGSAWNAPRHINRLWNR